MNSRKKKPVYCFNNDKIYPSIIQASKELGIDYPSIGQCCRGNRSSVKGYVFCYPEQRDNYEFRKDKRHTNGAKRKKSIVVIKKLGNIPPYDFCSKLYFNSITEASKVLDIPMASISANLQNRTKTCHGYIFQYYEPERSEQNVGV